MSACLLEEKRDGKVKGCTFANGSAQRGYINKEDATSSTVATESIAITATLDAKHGRDVMTIDVPNAFIQTDMEKIDGNRVIIKISWTTGRNASVIESRIIFTSCY
jgi:hypothetical protein